MNLQEKKDFPIIHYSLLIVHCLVARRGIEPLFQE